MKRTEAAWEFLHVPVDNFIMEAASKEGVSLPKKKGKHKEAKSWSNWEEDDENKEYSNFQKEIRDISEKAGYTAPIKWENLAWIKISENQKNKEI